MEMNLERKKLFFEYFIQENHTKQTVDLAYNQEGGTGEKTLKEISTKFIKKIHLNF